VGGGRGDQRTQLNGRGTQRLTPAAGADHKPFSEPLKGLIFFKPVCKKIKKNA